MLTTCELTSPTKRRCVIVKPQKKERSLYAVARRRPQNPARVVYMNEGDQTVNPLAGRTVSYGDPWAHLR